MYVFPDCGNIETFARKLLSLSASEEQFGIPDQNQVQIQGQHSSQGPYQESRAKQAKVQCEMSKLEKGQCI